MIYFVTGGAGQIGRFLIPRLLERGGSVYMLVGDDELGEFARLRAAWGAGEGQLIPVTGDVSRIRLGVSQHFQGQLKHKLDHFFHLATEFDFAADGEAQARRNVDGVRRALGLAETLHAGCFHLLSSVAAVGRFVGLSDEQTFAEAPTLNNPYYVSYYYAERLVRASTLPWRIYRPGVVVGDSLDGATNGINGLYYFFEAIRSLGEALPPWLRGATPEGGSLNLVPVDYVGQALDHLAHLQQGDGECFLLTHPQGISAGQLLRLLVVLAGGPTLSVWSQRLPYGLLSGLRPGAAGYALSERFLAPFGVPVEALELATSPTRYDGSKARELLEPADIHCPDVDEYVDVLWRYWLDRLSDLNSRGPLLGRLVDGWYGRRNHSALSREVSGKVVVVAGYPGQLAGSCAGKLSAAGAELILVGAGKRRLQSEADRLARGGARPKPYVCDLDEAAACARVARKILKNYGHVDVLLNISNQADGGAGAAGASSAAPGALARHLGAMHLVHELSASMIARRQGHIVNVVARPRGATLAARSAADLVSRLLAAELASCGVRFDYLALPEAGRSEGGARRWLADALWHAPDEAAERVLKALTARPARLIRALAMLGPAGQSVVPELGAYSLRQVRRVTGKAHPALPAADKEPATTDGGEDSVPEELIAKLLDEASSGSLRAAAE